MEPGEFAVSILGLGQIGGSLALALKKRGFPGRIGGYDVDPARRDRASFFLDFSASRPEEAIAAADVVVLAAPVSAILETLESVGDRFPEKVFTDVGSTKKAVVELAARFPLLRLVPGHPFAGSELPGEAGWNPDLFAGRPYFLVRTEKTSAADFQLISDLVRQSGAFPVEVSADEHDRLLALSSHLPLAVSVAFARQMNGRPVQGRKEFVGTGLLSVARLAGGSPEMEADILLSNWKFIREELERFQAELARLAELLESGNREEILRYLRESQRAYWSLVPGKESPERGPEEK